MGTIELYCDETEDWPYEGHKTTFRFERGGFTWIETRRHIDADADRDEVERMGPEAGLRWLRERQFDPARITAVLTALLPALDLVVSESDDSRGVVDELRRVGSVWLHREPWRWVELPEVRERLAAAGWTPDQIAAAVD